LRELTRNSSMSLKPFGFYRSLSSFGKSRRLIFPTEILLCWKVLCCSRSSVNNEGIMLWYGNIMLFKVINQQRWMLRWTKRTIWWNLCFKISIKISHLETNVMCASKYPLRSHLWKPMYKCVPLSNLKNLYNFSNLKSIH